jgi:hypothetical protein
MSKPHVKARGLPFLARFAPYLLVVGLAFSPLTACYAHAYPDEVYIAHGGGYYNDGYRSHRRYYRDYGPRYYHRAPDRYYRAAPQYRGHQHHRHYHRDHW